jgi:surface antigen
VLPAVLSVCTNTACAGAGMRGAGAALAGSADSAAAAAPPAVAATSFQMGFMTLLRVMADLDTWSASGRA